MCTFAQGMYNLIRWEELFLYFSVGMKVLQVEIKELSIYLELRPELRWQSHVLQSSKRNVLQNIQITLKVQSS